MAGALSHPTFQPFYMSKSVSPTGRVRRGIPKSSPLHPDSKENKEKDDHGKSQAGAQYESIVEMVKALNSKSEKKQEEARERIEEDALCVEVRSAWTPLDRKLEPHEYSILLCTGGPAVRIFGTLDLHNEPLTARLEFQDWGTPWTEYYDTDEEMLLAYARCFYFGE